MRLQYQENPLLFLNSSGPSVPSGRNVRAQARTLQLSNAPPNQTGYFGQIQLSIKRDNDENKSRSPPKRRKAVVSLNGQHVTSLRRKSDQTTAETPSNDVALSRSVSPNASVDPSEILAAATFHIRRIAAMTIRQHPERLRDVLRCRQWSCVSVAFQRSGKCPYVDSALLAVAAKLRQITGNSGTSPMVVLSSYTEALHDLQRALQNPAEHDNLDLLTSTQLLAVYEMLDSLDEETWAKHIAGAISLARPLEILSQDERRATKLTFARAAPIFTDALLTGNGEVLHGYPWHALLESALQMNPALPNFCRGPLRCLIDLPEVLDDARIGQHVDDADATAAMAVLDRAHALKARLRTGLLQNDLYSRNGHSALESFDLLGMCLAALVALDRVIVSLHPIEARNRELTEDKTNELCAQLLQLELGAADAYPATDLMRGFAISAFQENPGFVIVLPGGQR
jgi:hypothetical protein